jgi:hypothetical protein
MISDSVAVLFRSLVRSDREVFLHYIHLHDLLYTFAYFRSIFFINSSFQCNLF